MSIEINYGKCMARLKKDKSLQCKNNKKCGDFCKLHMNTTIENRIDWNTCIITHDEQPNNVKYLEKSHLDIVNRFNIKQLKNTIKHYKIVTNKTKRKDIINIIKYYFKSIDNFTDSDINKLKIIQNNIRDRNNQKRNNLINNLRGEAFYNRSLCTNDDDFLTFINCNDIPPDDFVSFKDNNNFHYGFHVKSLYQIIKADSINPYNRDKIPDNELDRINKLYHILENNDTILNISNNETQNPNEKTLQRTINIFKLIDDLGYYTQIKWFWDLQLHGLKNFYLQAEDIWNYRAYDLTPEIKQNIIKPDGRCFNKLSKVQISKNIDEVRNLCLDEIEKMVTSGVSEADKKVGAMYILSALVIVSYNAACSLPWLLDSVM